MTKRSWFIDTNNNVEDIKAMVVNLTYYPDCFINLQTVECGYVQLTVIADQADIAEIEDIVTPYV